MKPIELKEICVDIDIQLPREECERETSEDCRYEPKEVASPDKIVQKKSDDDPSFLLGR